MPGIRGERPSSPRALRLYAIPLMTPLMFLSPVRGRRTFADQQLKGRPDAFGILNDFIRPQADDPPSHALHHGCTPCIRFRLVSMVIAINLDDEILRCAHEIGEVRPNRMLSAELNTLHSMRAYQLPAQAVGSAGIASQFSCSLRLPTHAPSPRL